MSDATKGATSDVSRATERRPRLLDRLAALLGVRLVVWLLVGAALTPSLWTSPHRVTGHYDEHYFYAHDDAARITLAEYHELPAWNPYYCGGIPLAANPQDESLAPDFLLRVLYGTGPGRRLAVLLFLVLGMEGMFQLARRHRVSVVGAAAAAVLFAAQGRFFFMLEFGWLNMFGFELLPWVVLGYEEARRSWRYGLVGGCALGWMLLAGGTYSVPYTALVLIALSIFDTIAGVVGKVRRGASAHEPWWRPLVALALVAASGAAFGAAKLVPMLRVVGAHPRTIHLPQRVDAYQLLSAMLTSHLEKPTGLAAEGYLGATAALFALVALLLRDRPAARFMTMAVLFFAFGMGEQGPWAPWSLARHLPLYGQLRNPERFTLVIGFFFALSAARAFTLIEGMPRVIGERVIARVLAWRERPPLDPLPPLARVGFAVIGLLVAGDLAYAATNELVADDRVHQVLFTQDAPVRRAAEFRQARGNRWDAHVFAPMARGTLQCFEETEFPQSPRLRADIPDEEYTLTSSARVERLAWSPNHIKLRVKSDLEITVLVNQNYAAGWSASVGNVSSVDGLLSVAVPAGTHEVVLSYDDRLFDLGLLISLAMTVFAARHFARWAKPRLVAMRDELRRAKPTQSSS